jgi:hypothetical protein
LHDLRTLAHRESKGGERVTVSDVLRRSVMRTLKLAERRRRDRKNH